MFFFYIEFTKKKPTGFQHLVEPRHMDQIDRHTLEYCPCLTLTQEYIYIYTYSIFISSYSLNLNPGTEECDNTKHYVYHRINS